jgi:hypothetical protein
MVCMAWTVGMADILGTGLRGLISSMKKLFMLGWLVLGLTLSTTSIFAADTANVLGGGVCINEILIDPNSASANTDTDGNGTAHDTDEFIELYNLSGSDIDISGWQLWDAGMHLWYQFAGNVDDGTTVLKARAYAVVVVGVQTGGSLPTMTNPDSLAFDAGQTGAVMNNIADNVVLYDPGPDEYIQLKYNGDADDMPPVDYAADGFSVTAKRMGTIEDFGSDTDGKSLTRYPSGDTYVLVHDAIPGIDSTASPNRLTVRNLAAHGISPMKVVAIIFSLVIGFVILKKRQLSGHVS